MLQPRNSIRGIVFGCLFGFVAIASLTSVQNQASAQNQYELPSQLSPSQGSSQYENGIRIGGCIVQFNYKTKVPAKADGPLTDLMVEEGQLVKKGDVIALVDNRQAELTMELKLREEVVAKIKAQDHINYRDAVATEKIARAEAKAYEELFDQSAAPFWEMRKKQAEADRAQLRIELAELNEKSAMAEYMVKQAETSLAKYEIEMRTVRADFDAFVENRFAQLGEWVQRGSPIVELVQMDELRVEGAVDALSYGRKLRRGQSAKIRIVVGGTADEPVFEEFDATLDYISTELDLKQAHRVWAKIKNRKVGDDWLIKPGMEAVMYVNP
ncbi:HlyD family efflux transporter periplasmic adaptor subunit [Stieleria sp. JC731]|uniref:efflux RND transporter periplasmic adaptor subunit n=1 Tax=Pirellulaceae TaxID=2691357 RepID=UPI001E3539DD|nr:HlyD family efflux transporter periplasmic adaptor subunit [Stieleria sp. JC731]MCC9604161.1 HlyD family efflux transporter periplasmic adaptor subunit [Stieleria sp. JC731]